MKNIEKNAKNESGAVQIIEMTFIMPMVILVLGFLIYMASYIMQSISIYSETQQVAVAASREAAFPGYDELYAAEGVTIHTDFSTTEASKFPGLINQIMGERDEPYRYWFGSSLQQSSITQLENGLEKLVTDTSFLSKSDVDCKITVQSNVLSQKVIVNTVKKVSVPKLFSYIGFKGDYDINITTVAVASDPAEFVRNTDMAFDLKDFLLDNLHIGNQSLGERISQYKQKFSDFAAKLGIGK